MLQYCITCKSELPASGGDCAICNAIGSMPGADYTESEVVDIGEDETQVAEPSRSGMIWGISALAVSLALTAAYYFIFLQDDVTPPRKKYAETVAAASAVQAEPVTLYAMVKANIRDKPTTKGSNIIGSLPRGSAASGQMQIGATAQDKWLELADGAGFISAVNLSDKTPPQIAKSLNDKIWTTDGPVDIWTSPRGGEIIDRVAKDTPLILVGLVAGDYIEIKLRAGGVGYISGGARIIELMDTPAAQPITMTFKPDSCDFGGGVGTLFAQLTRQKDARRAAVENRDYPNPDARQDALEAYDQKNDERSAYAKLSREYKGLTITAIGNHYEAQSVYFGNPPAKVIAAFKQAGYAIKNDGAFQTKDLYAAIAPAKTYGASELICGV